MGVDGNQLAMLGGKTTAYRSITKKVKAQEVNSRPIFDIAAKKKMALKGAGPVQAFTERKLAQRKNQSVLPTVQSQGELDPYITKVSAIRMSQEPHNMDRLEIKVPDMLGYNTMARKTSGTPEQSIERQVPNKLTAGSRRSSQVSLSKAIYDEAQRMIGKRA